jgi:hypothetical protein
MNNRGNDKDLLRQYINPGMREKAPEDFTSDFMSIIKKEISPCSTLTHLPTRNTIPVISVIIAVSLIIASILLPGSQTDKFVLPLTGLFKNINLLLPEIDLKSIFNFPELMIYVFIGIFILSILDKALSAFFHRE